MKKLIIPSIAIVIFILGTIFLLLPFIPLGWLMITLSALLLSPYIKVMRRFISWLSSLDKTGFVKKAGDKASHLYAWVGDQKSAKKMNAMVEKNLESPNNQPTNKPN